jgi:molybdopterin-guanine dinucleotide biosynthesis protein A
VLAVYAFTGGRFQDQTAEYSDYLQEVLHQNQAKWRQEKNRTMDLLQTLAVDYAVVGQKDEGKRFFALNLDQFIPSLQKRQVDPNSCLESLEGLLDRVPAAGP